MSPTSSTLTLGPSEHSHRIETQINLYSRVAPTVVLIVGEEGAGKMAAARTLHQMSARATESFHVFSPLEKDPTEIEIALFGHTTMGLLGEASEGTLLIEHVDALPHSVQGRLFDFHQSREYVPCGGGRPATSRTWVIYSSAAYLPDLVAARAMNYSFYARISVLRLEIPPLRERFEDLPEILRGLAGEIDPILAKMVAAQPDDFWEPLRRYEWPGNVGELRSRLVRCFESNRGGGAEALRRCLSEQILPK